MARTFRQSPLLAALFFAVFYICFFSPALFTGRELAPIDSFHFYYPHYNSPEKLWDPLLMTGYPALGDPQLMSWYPPALLLRRIPGSWNTFVLSGYFLASFFMFMLVRKLTGRDFAGLVSGLMFGVCGFMAAHLAHITMIHTVAWIPAILLCVEHLGNEVRWRWVAAGGLGMGACVLAGHPQIALYGLTLVAAFALVRGFWTVSGRASYYAACAGMVAIGFALSAVQILPTAELAGLTTRARVSFLEFSSFSLPPWQLASFLFPFLFGGTGSAFPARIPYFGLWNLAEITGYVGFAGLVLATIAMVSRRSAKVFFWAACMAVSLCASMGAETPLGRIVYAMPVFGQFRAQGRFLVIFEIAATILAGYGVAAILERKEPFRNALVAGAAGLGLVLYAARIPLANAAALQRAARGAGVEQLSTSAFSNPCIGIPLLIGFGACVILTLLIRRPNSYVWRTALVLAVALELEAFSGYLDWRVASPRLEQFKEPETVHNQRSILKRTEGRWVPVRGGMGSTAEGLPDVSVLWQLPSLSKFGPLLPVRYSELLDMDTSGEFPGHWWEPANRAIDLAGGRFVAVPVVPLTGGRFFHGVGFLEQNLSLSIGHGCGAVSGSESVFIKPEQIRGLALVTFAGCSPQFPQGTPLAEVRLEQPSGGSIPLTIRAGVETSEWAAGCPDVASAMRHRAAEIYSRFAIPRVGANCEGQKYGAILELPKPAVVSRLDFKWLQSGSGVLKIDKITLLDGTAKHSQPLSEQDVAMGDTARWKRLSESDGVDVYENLRALPRVWVTSETRRLQPAEVMHAIQTSRLPDGQEYPVSDSALVEDMPEFRAVPDPSGTVRLLKDAGNSLEIRTVSQQPAFLVLADFFYPGWRATVNGHPAHIYRTNYIQRGVQIPAGTSLVRFEFHPTQLYVGGGISLGTLISMMLVSLWLYLRRHSGAGLNGDRQSASE